MADITLYSLLSSDIYTYHSFSMFCTCAVLLFIQLKLYSCYDSHVFKADFSNKYLLENTIEGITYEFL